MALVLVMQEGGVTQEVLVIQCSDFRSVSCAVVVCLCEPVWNGVSYSQSVHCEAISYASCNTLSENILAPVLGRPGGAMATALEEGD
jgi:hypothetical protein